MDTRIVNDPFYNSRRGQWGDASRALGGSNFPITFDVQNLGTAENRLLIWEADVKRIHDNRHNPDRPILSAMDSISEDMAFDELIAFSQLWIYGVYEVLRTIKEKMWSETIEVKTGGGFPAPMHHFNELYKILEILRMPLAKHQVKGKKEEHHATLMYNPEFGSTVWAVYHPKQKHYVQLIRREIGDEFLRVAQLVKAERDAARAQAEANQAI